MKPTGVSPVMGVDIHSHFFIGLQETTFRKEETIMSKKLNLLIRVSNKTEHAVAVARAVVKAGSETSIKVDKLKDLKSLLAAATQGKLDILSHNIETLRLVTGAPVVEEDGAEVVGGDGEGDDVGGEGEKKDADGEGAGDEGDKEEADGEGAGDEGDKEEADVEGDKQDEAVDSVEKIEVVAPVDAVDVVAPVDKKKRKPAAPKKEEK